jgi:hypothetical protein
MTNGGEARAARSLRSQLIDVLARESDPAVVRSALAYVWCGVRDDCRRSRALAYPTSRGPFVENFKSICISRERCTNA